MGCFVIKLIMLGAPGADDLLNFDPSFSRVFLLGSRILPSTSFCMLEIFPVTSRWWKGTWEGGVWRGRRAAEALGGPWWVPREGALIIYYLPSWASWQVLCRHQTDCPSQ